MAASPSAPHQNHVTTNNRYVTTNPPEDYLLACLEEEGDPRLRRAWRRWAAATYLSALFSPYGRVPAFIELRAIRERADYTDRERAFFPLPTFNAEQTGLRDSLLEEIWRWVELWDGQKFNVYAGLLPRLNEYRATKEYIPCGNVAWLDVDFKSQSQSEIEIALRHFNPEMQVLSGNGIHCYVWSSVFFDFTDAQERDAFEKCLAGLNRAFGSDRTHDTTRILRLPGTRNWKDARRPKEVLLHTYPQIFHYKEPK